MQHGERYAKDATYRRRLDAKIARLNRQTDPIRAEAARLQAEGMTAEETWAKVMVRVVA